MPPVKTLRNSGLDSLLFYSLLLPSLLAIFFWWTANADRNVTGNNFPLLFQNFDLFMDWLIPVEWAKTEVPWKYFGSIYEGKLPPSFYGPMTFLILTPLSAASNLIDKFKSIYISQMTFALISALFSAFTVATYNAVKKYILVNNQTDDEREAGNAPILFFSILALYPMIFSFHRGSTSIIGSMFLSMYIYFVVNKKTLTSTMFLCLAILSQFQLLILAPLLFLKNRRHFLPLSIGIIATGYGLLVLKTGFQNLIATYNYNKQLFKGVTYMAHDLSSAIHVLAGAQYMVLMPLLAAGIYIFFLLILFISKRFRVDLKLFDSPAHLSESAWAREICLGYILILLSLILPNPSFAYHLTRLIPFLVPLFFVNYFSRSSFFVVSQGILFSYLQLWEIGSADSAVILRAAILIFDLIFAANILHILYAKKNICDDLAITLSGQNLSGSPLK